MVGRLRPAWLAAIVVVGFVSPARPNDPMELVGRWPYGPAIAVAVSDGFACFVSGSSLVVSEISDPHSPEVLGRVTLPDVANLVDVDAGLAYVVTDSKSLVVIDIGLPSDPTIRGSLDLPENPRRIAVADGLAYIALGQTGLYLVDVSVPSSPRVVEIIDVDAYDVVLSGRHAYIGSEDLLRVFDVSVPTSAVEIGSTPGFFVWGNLAVSGDLVLAAELRRLNVYDVSDPTNPYLVGQSDKFAGFPRGIAVVGNFVVVLGTDPPGVFVLDVADPSAPVLTSTIDMWTNGVAAFGNFVAIAAIDDGLLIMRTDVDGQLSEVGVVQTPGSEFSVAASDGLAMVAAADGLRILDLSTPEQPAEVGFFESPRGSWDVDVVENLAFIVGDSASLRVIDVSDPASPTEIGGYVADAPASRDVEVSGGFAYIVANYQGIVVDVRNLSTPVFAGLLFEARHAVHDVEVSGDYAFVVGIEYESIHVFDVTTPADPVLVSEIHTSGEPVDIEIEGSLAYVALPALGSFVTPQGLQVFDVEDPTSPVEVAFLGIYEEMWWSADLAVAGDCAVIGTGPMLYAIDVSVPANPILVGKHEIPGSVSNLATYDDLLHVSEYGAGYENYDISGCAGLARAPRQTQGRRIPESP